MVFLGGTLEELELLSLESSLGHKPECYLHALETRASTLQGEGVVLTVYHDTNDYSA